MYKLMIVDDEASARTGLKECVNWNSLGIELVAEAEDGELALELLEHTHVHILLTDVRMPHMDGIELSNIIYRRYPDIKLVFVSGFAELNYLKSALKVDAVDYILKPVRLVELHEVIQRITLQLAEDQRRNDNLLIQQYKLNQSIPLLRERYLAALVVDGVHLETDMREKFELLDIQLPLDGDRFGIFVICLDDYHTTWGSKTEREKQLLSFALLNICEDLINEHAQGHAFEVRPGEYAGIVHFQSDDEEEALYTLLDQCKQQLNRLLRLEVTIGVSGAVSGWNALPISYRQAIEAARHKWFLGNNQLISIDSLSMIPSASPIDWPDIRQFPALLKSEDWSQPAQFLEQLNKVSQELGLAGIRPTRNICGLLLINCSELLIELDLFTDELRESESKAWDAVPLAETNSELLSCLEAHVRLTYDAIRSKRENKTRHVISHIKHYIEEHFAEDLSIAAIASFVYLTPTYICLLFKQETGMTINEYVIRVRIEEAKQQLKDPGNKLYDICYAVGYKDPSYFSKLFKKHTSLTPSEFRDQL
jgi:two-component system response regulator YesN